MQDTRKKKRGEATPPVQIKPAGYSHTINVAERGLPYHTAKDGSAPKTREEIETWFRERLPKLIAVIMPVDGLVFESSSDEVGAALMEIVFALTFTGPDERENFLTAIALEVFSRTTTSLNACGDFYMRRLIFPQC